MIKERTVAKNSCKNALSYSCRLYNDDHTQEVVEKYLGSTTTSNLCLDVDINNCTRKSTSVMSRLSKRVWENSMLTENTKVRVYQDCVLNILLYGSEARTTCAKQERHPQHVHADKSATSALDWPCLSHEGWTYSKGRPLW